MSKREEQQSEVATFLGGCFWCMVEPFDTKPGIKSVISGYIGGHTENPTYEEVCSGTTGHREAVQITFDPNVFSYDRLLDIFWQQIDPTDNGGQFTSRGSSYETGIYYHSDAQKRLAEESKASLAASGRFTKPIVTKIKAASTFYPAEDYHQDYYKKNPDKYAAFKERSGRIEFKQDHWKSPEHSS